MVPRARCTRRGSGCVVVSLTEPPWNAGAVTLPTLSATVCGARSRVNRRSPIRPRSRGFELGGEAQELRFAAELAEEVHAYGQVVVAPVEWDRHRRATGHVGG